jgi:hypothetical protein
MKDKELLLKDLSARLLYGVKVQYTAGDGDTCIDCDIDYVSMRSQCVGISDNVEKPFVWRFIESIKPYLRPMSSMTDEEKKEYENLLFTATEWEIVDWLNAHHFDYRGLIEKGLALKAKEGMYN